MHFYGGVAPEAQTDLAAYRGRTPLSHHGSVSQGELAEGFGAASVLVLPSLEEGFGLVIPQALNCGVPCIVSDRVGGKDLVRHRENGSIFPCRDVGALAGELVWWEANWRATNESHGWAEPARQVMAASGAAG
jgi:glycosyltransferase involved in cell wall biosynthesis